VQPCSYLSDGGRCDARVNGEACAFCCYGCCIAYQIKSGQTEEWELLGVDPARCRRFSLHEYLLFSLLLLPTPSAARCRDASLDSSPALAARHTRVIISRRDHFYARLWLHAMQGRFDVLGAHRARRGRRPISNSAFASRAQRQCHFDTAEHGLSCSPWAIISIRRACTGGA